MAIIKHQQKKKNLKLQWLNMFFFIIMRKSTILRKIALHQNYIQTHQDKINFHKLKIDELVEKLKLKGCSIPQEIR